MERRPYNPLNSERQAGISVAALKKETHGIIDYMPEELGFSESLELTDIRKYVIEKVTAGGDTIVLRSSLDLYDEVDVRRAEYLICSKPEERFALVGFMMKRITFHIEVSPMHYQQALLEALKWTTFYGLRHYRQIIQRAYENFVDLQRATTLPRV